ncbi:hypothetical protein BDV36DRAFT_308366 [Aspergillus pseudocaelatus]|nr:hypothetical protein BDV36DRAFT_308366 [Aspergillus pseudocaelatus]
MQQIKHWRRPSQPKPHDPVLTSEDEAFLQNIVSEPTPTSEAPHPSTGAADDSRSPVSPIATDAPDTLLSPVSPLEEFRELGEEARKAREKEEQRSGPDPQRQSSKDGSSSQTEEKKKKTWSSWLRRKTTVKKTEVSGDEQTKPPTDSKDENDARQETEDMTEILERLNLAADNNRVFSVSEEMQELLRKFKLIFKDLINGVPTAYHDLEMLLTNGNTQLQGAYSKLPGPIQKLIEKLPERWTETLAPEMIAVASERAAKSGVNIDNIGKAAAAANKMGIKVPSLKELVGKPAAIVGMLRSIMAFLRARFPAVLGMNVLWSLALSILLFVLWYCHKRGREVRLENERLVTEEEIEKLNEQSSSDERIRTTETLTTTAPQGASAAEIREGVKDAQQSRERAMAAAESTQLENNDMKDNNPKPTRSKSILSIWGRSSQKPEPATKIQPYPGT